MTGADRIAEYIRGVFMRPRLYAANAAELEMILLTAMQCWLLAAGRIRDTEDIVHQGDLVSRWWREEVEAACTKAGEEYGAASRLATLGSTEEVRTERTAKHLRRVWRRMQSAIDRLGGLAPPPG